MILDLGLIDYEDCYRKQKEFVRRRKLGKIEDSVIIAEHNAVFTIGRLGSADNLLVSPEFLERRGVKVLKVDRGGDITFHGPGQLVLYPIIDLKSGIKDLHRYLRNLEEVLIRYLDGYGVRGIRVAGKTGVWSKDEKIASIGIAASDWVTYHGAAININTDLNFFSMINPCGIKDIKMSSLAVILNKPVNIAEAKERLLFNFKSVFNFGELDLVKRDARLTDIERFQSGRPDWLKKRLVFGKVASEVKGILSKHNINTVCESGLCPNLNECFSRKRATFLILGKNCTRGCSFCSVKKGSPAAIDPDEPERILEAVKTLALSYVIVTSVTRDDLADAGASQFVKTIEIIRNFSRDIRIEVLVPDFRGERKLIERVVSAKPDIFGHNIETINRLYLLVRSASDYERSLSVLKSAKAFDRNSITKSGIMVGLGETAREVIEAMEDLRLAGCDILTIGQYLRPGADNAPVRRFVSPEEFKDYERIGCSLGFKHVSSAPFVRSSYFAENIYPAIKRCI